MNSHVQSVLDTFRLSWDRYTQFQYSQGLFYIRHQFAHDEETAQLLEASEAFWAWWRHLWERRDQALLREIEDLGLQLSQGERTALYMGTHDVPKLRTYPNRIILDASMKQLCK